MRKLVVRIIGIALAFYIASYLIGGFRIDPTWQSYLIASVVFLIFNLFASPIIKILLLPINLLTLGLFRWVANVLVLYIFDLIYGGLTISAYRFPGFSSPSLSLPAADLSLFWVLVLSSLTISLTYSLFSSLLTAE